MSNTYSKEKILLLTQLAILTSIEILMAFTPLGSIPFTPIVVATLAHVPVILAAVTMGKKAGLYMGTLFGALSFIVWTLYAPNPFFAPVFTPFYSAGPFRGNFWSVVICFVPRILIGLFAALTYSAIYKWRKSVITASVVASIIGTLTNTILVLTGAYVFFGSHVAKGQTLFAFLYAGVGINGVLEIAAAVILVPPLALAIKKIKI